MAGSASNRAVRELLVAMASVAVMARPLPFMVTPLFDVPFCVKTQVTNDGRLPQLKVSVPEYPPTGVNVSVVVPVCPCAMLNVAGFAAIV
jgi:hypothetical protein